MERGTVDPALWEPTEVLYEGKAKVVYRTADPEVLVLRYKDDATAFNAAKRATLAGKGALNNRIAALFFSLIERQGVAHHFLALRSEVESCVLALEMVPLEVVVRNVAAGSLAKRLGLAEGSALSEPVVELYHKNDALGDPLVNRYHVRTMRWAADAEVDELEALALRVNGILRAAVREVDLELVDFKLEFGRRGGRLLVGDEISPDTCRLWDRRTGEKLDKDRFRFDLGDLTEGYREVLRRIESVAETAAEQDPAGRR